mmetsp:Transcript_16647/g.25036  ORF Transcript_16647/g.25036 Transcript_16647/m.25036 type:complete len:465 (-) Transcript_16647:75-1469(-)
MAFAFPLLLLFGVLAQCESNGGYRGAVVDFWPKMLHQDGQKLNYSASEVMRINIAEMETIIKDASAQNADIIVFPEYALSGPDFATRGDILAYALITQCEDEIIGLICKLAFEYDMTIVAHVIERREEKLYSAQLAISPDFEVIGKYNKKHLYGHESLLLSPGDSHQPEAKFRLKNGLTFDMLICFDMMFNSYTSDSNVKNVVFSSWWVNYPPLLTATQVQQAWSRTFNRNLLASGSNGDASLSSGSGIYLGDGTILQQSYNADSTFNSSFLLIADVNMENRPNLNIDASRNDTTEITNRSQIVGKHKFDFVNITKVNLSRGQSSASVTSLGKTINCSVDVLVEKFYDIETFALVTAEGMYNGHFKSRMCSFLKCWDIENCLDSVIIGSQSTFYAVNVTSEGMKMNSLRYVLGMGAQSFSYAVPTRLDDLVDEKILLSLDLADSVTGSLDVLDLTLFEMEYVRS